MKKIIIFDTTLRDGEQSPGASLNVEEKIMIAKQLEKMGVDVIEAGFPIASEGDFDAVKKIASEINNSVICGLARASKKDIERCWEAIKDAKMKRIHTFIATSQIHRENKLRKSKDDIIKITEEAVSYAKSLCEDVEFSPEDASRTDLDYMCDVIKAAIIAGATTINVPDTVGYAQPEEFRKRIEYILKKVPESKEIVLSVHCHNDLGNAVANSLAAIEGGATQVECCINGIGERAGNASTEEVVMNLHTRKDYYQAETSIKTREIYKTSRLVSNLTGLYVQRNKAIIGKNAFSHEAGIHQHGVLADKNTYEIMNAEDIGWEGENIVIGKHSGKHAIQDMIEKEGYSLTKEQCDQVVKKVKELADKQKNIEKDDVIAITMDVIHQLTDSEKLIKLREFSVMTGNNTPTCSVKLEVEGEEKFGVGVGVGPVDALSKAIWDVIGPSLKFVEYNLKAITGGTDALAHVNVKMEDDKKNRFSANAVNEDVIKASAMAIIKGANKAMNFARQKK